VGVGDTGIREGSLQAPSRHPLDWRSAEFTDDAALEKELERVFDICHGCRRCFSLCQSFPTLFDAIDASETLELDGVDKKVYWDVVDNCYLCDMCFMTKCPYVPPHPWNVDFPHLMLRAKHVQHRKGEHNLRDRLLSNTRGLGSIAGIPVIAEIVNAVNGTKVGRKLLEATLGVDATAPIPKFHSTTGSSRARRAAGKAIEVKPTEETRGQVALFVTCYGDRNEPHMPEDLTAVFEHNGIAVKVVAKEKCCGMPKLEIGDLATVAKYKEFNIRSSSGSSMRAMTSSPDSLLRAHVQAGTAADVPGRRRGAGCQGADLRSVRIPDAAPQGRRAAYRFHAEVRQGQLPRALSPARAEHRLKTRDVLRLVPGTTVEVIERCSGHNGTYAVKKEFRAASVKIGGR
jgi:Fe-S oxidoreductase